MEGCAQDCLERSMSFLACGPHPTPPLQLRCVRCVGCRLLLCSVVLCCLRLFVCCCVVCCWSFAVQCSLLDRSWVHRSNAYICLASDLRLQPLPSCGGLRSGPPRPIDVCLCLCSPPHPTPPTPLCAFCCLSFAAVLCGVVLFASLCSLLCCVLLVVCC